MPVLNQSRWFCTVGTNADVLNLIFRMEFDLYKHYKWHQDQVYVIVKWPY